MPALAKMSESTVTTSTKTWRWKAKLDVTESERMTRMMRKTRKTRITRTHCTMTWMRDSSPPAISHMTIAGTTVTKSSSETSEKKYLRRGRAGA